MTILENIFKVVLSRQVMILNNASSGICGMCKHCMCCKMEPAFLTIYDLKKIEEATGLTRERFSLTKELDGKTIRVLRQRHDSWCYFFDEEKRKCKIYQVRPLDCRLFPLDIDRRQNEYLWMYYTFCGQKYLSHFFFKVMSKMAEWRIIPHLRNHMEEYARMDMELYYQKKWRNLATVNL